MDKAKLSRHARARMPKYLHSPPTARPVEVLVFPSVQLLDVTGPIQVFASANDFATQSGLPPPYEVRVVAQDGPSVAASAGVTLGAHSLPKIGSPVDTLIVAGGHGVEAAGKLVLRDA